MVTTPNIKINMVIYLENLIDRLYVLYVFIMHVKFCAIGYYLLSIFKLISLCVILYYKNLNSSLCSYHAR